MASLKAVEDRNDAKDIFKKATCLKINMTKNEESNQKLKPKLQLYDHVFFWYKIVTQHHGLVTDIDDDGNVEILEVYRDKDNIKYRFISYEKFSRFGRFLVQKARYDDLWYFLKAPSTSFFSNVLPFSETQKMIDHLREISDDLQKHDNIKFLIEDTDGNPKKIKWNNSFSSFDNNCETFVRMLKTGEKCVSRQSYYFCKIFIFNFLTVFYFCFAAVTLMVYFVFIHLKNAIRKISDLFV